MTNHVNNVHLIGFAAEAPSIASTRKCDVAKFDIKTYVKGWKSNRVRCVAFAETAKSIRGEFGAGDLIEVYGMVKSGKWESKKEDWEKEKDYKRTYYSCEIMALEVNVLERGPGGPEKEKVSV